MPHRHSDDARDRPILHDTRHAPEDSPHDVADTAFWVNVDRSRRVDLSRDIYAHLWVTPRSRQLWEEMAREVYPYSDISVSLRNRYYLEGMERFFAGAARPRLVNIAAGFTMYPYLLDGSVAVLEADYPKVVAYKSEKAAPWRASGLLPERPVDYCGVDLADDADRDRLLERIAVWLGGEPGFTLLEGLTYYLPREVLDALFAGLAAVLPAGSLVAFEHWPTDAGDYPAFVRFKRHMEEKFGWQTRALSLFDDDYVRSLPGLALREAVDLPEVERRYSDARILAEKANRLPHLFKVLAVAGR
jgi:O-methyltransferase involved in polyketide biosynthesis